MKAADITDMWLRSIGCRSYNGGRVFAFDIDASHSIYFTPDPSSPTRWNVAVCYCGESVPLARQLAHRGDVVTLIPALGGRVRRPIQGDDEPGWQDVCFGVAGARLPDRIVDLDAETV